jgi:hypothetical protein
VSHLFYSISLQRTFYADFVVLVKKLELEKQRVAKYQFNITTKRNVRQKKEAAPSRKYIIRNPLGRTGGVGADDKKPPETSSI